MAAVSSFIKNAKPCILRMLLLTLVASSARPKRLYVGLVSVCLSVVCLSLQLIAGMSRNEDRHRLVFFPKAFVGRPSVTLPKLSDTMWLTGCFQQRAQKTRRN